MSPNPLLDALPAYPFAALRTLLDPVTPRVNDRPIDMAVGDPQHRPPSLLADTIAAHADCWNSYPPMAGTSELREAIAAWLTRRYHLPPGMITADRNIVTLAGSREGLCQLANLVIPRQKAGTRPVVLMPNPHFLIYNSAATMAGAEAVFLDATAAHGFMPDLDAIPSATLERTALFYLCSPANPQGAFASLDYLKKAIALARRYDFVLAADECYCEIYDRAAPPGALEACAAMGGALDQVLVFHSLSKRSSAAGLRSGFAAGDPRLVADFTRLRSYHGCHVPVPIQAAAAALWRDEAHVEENRAKYRHKFDIAEAQFGGRYGFYRPNGGFFLWLDVENGEAVAARLWREAAVKVLPGAYLACAPSAEANPAKNYIRIALVHDEALVEEASTRISRVL